MRQHAVHDQTDRCPLAPDPLRVLQARRVGGNDRRAWSGEFEKFQVLSWDTDFTGFRVEF